MAYRIIVQVEDDTALGSLVRTIQGLGTIATIEPVDTGHLNGSSSGTTPKRPTISEFILTTFRQHRTFTRAQVLDAMKTAGFETVKSADPAIDKLKNEKLLKSVALGVYTFTTKGKAAMHA